MKEEEAKREEVQRQFHNKIKEIEDDLHRQYLAKEHKVLLQLFLVASSWSLNRLNISRDNFHLLPTVLYFVNDITISMSLSRAFKI